MCPDYRTYCSELVRFERLIHDLISQLLEARIDGKLLDDQHLNGMLRLLLIAGIDTTWSGIGAALWHLASTCDFFSSPFGGNSAPAAACSRETNREEASSRFQGVT